MDGEMNASGSAVDQKNSSWSNSIFPRWKEAIFLTTVAGMSALFGFGRTVTAAQKHDPKVAENLSQALHFEGNRLAMRALGWGTLYAFTGTGLICYGIWKLSGANNFKEFRVKAGNVLPRIPRREADPNTRTEFANLTDLIQYIIDEDNKNKTLLESKPSPDLKPVPAVATEK